MASLGHYGEYDRYLRWLAEAQRYKLHINAHKGPLGDKDPATLLEKLKGEIIELEDAAKRGSAIEMILEAADIANFALGFIIAALKNEEELQVVEPQALKSPLVLICATCGNATECHLCDDPLCPHAVV